MTKHKLDHPFDEIVAMADIIVGLGAEVHQKFTCSGCGARLGIDEPNVFHERGTCDRCPAVTDIRKQGCNYMLISRDPDILQKAARAAREGAKPSGKVRVLH